MESVLLDAETWERIETPEAPKGGPFVLGIDLGQNAAMSAAKAVAADAGGHEQRPGNDRPGWPCEAGKRRSGAALTVSG